MPPTCARCTRPFGGYRGGALVSAIVRGKPRGGSTSIMPSHPPLDNRSRVAVCHDRIPDGQGERLVEQRAGRPAGEVVLPTCHQARSEGARVGVPFGEELGSAR